MEIENIFRSSTQDRAFLKIDSRIRFIHFVLMIPMILLSSGYFLLFPALYLFSSLLYLGTERKTLFRVMLVAALFFILYQLPYLVSARETNPAQMVKGIRFSLFLLNSFLLVNTVSPEEISDFLYFLLKRIPGFPAARLSFMTELTLAFIPLIFDSFSETAQASTSRCLGSRRNLFKKVYYSSAPPLERILTKSQEKADALESRCINPEIRFLPRPLNYRELSWLVPGSLVNFCLLIIHFI